MNLTKTLNFLAIFTFALTVRIVHAAPVIEIIPSETDSTRIKSVIIRSDNLYMRSIQPEDEGHCTHVFSDPLAMSQYMEGGPRPPEEITRRFSKYLSWGQAGNPFGYYRVTLEGEAAERFLKRQEDLLAQFQKVIAPLGRGLPLGAELNRLPLLLASLKQEFETSKELFVGHVLLEPGEDRKGIETDAEISYVFRPAFWGQKYGTEAVENIVALAKLLLAKSIPLNSNLITALIATARADNPGSCGVLLKNGFIVFKEQEKFGIRRLFYIKPLSEDRETSADTAAPADASNAIVPVSPDITLVPPGLDDRVVTSVQ